MILRPLRSSAEGSVRKILETPIEEFRRQFNETRPHSALGNLTPAEFKRNLSTTNPDPAISKV